MITMQHDPTIIGTVQDVKGATVSVALHDETVSGLSFVDGAAYRLGQLGTFVRIPLGYVSLFGVVSQVGAGAVPEKLLETHPYGNRWLTVQLIGEVGEGRVFDRGVSQYPTINDLVHLVTDADLEVIYGRPNSARYIRVGHVASVESIPALLDLNRLISRHSAVVGTTGSGKSTTVASLLQQLSDSVRYPSARVLLIDIHGEYASALRGKSNVFRINPGPNEHALVVPYWALTFDDLLPLTFGGMEDAPRAAVMDLINQRKRDSLESQPRRGVTEATLTVDTPIPFSIQQLWFDLHVREHATYIQDQNRPDSEWQPAYVVSEGVHQIGDALGVLPPQYRALKNVAGDTEKIQQGKVALNIRRHLATLASRLRDPRLAFLFQPGEWLPKANGETKRDLDELLALWLGNDRPISILDLSGVPASIISQIVGALLRILYDAVFWARNLPEGGRERPLLIVLEEAHTYLNKDTASSANEAVRRIAKEGRKYGISAMIVSQRPAEVDPTILSQCGTIIAMRLSNEADRKHITSAASDTLEGLFSILPVLRVGEAIIVGEAVSLPIRTLIEKPAEDSLPDSRDPKPVVDEVDGEFASAGGWNQRRDPDDYRQVMEVWRRQNPKPERRDRGD
jgi:DNA helicase HerA-like ATPase